MCALDVLYSASDHHLAAQLEDAIVAALFKDATRESAEVSKNAKVDCRSEESNESVKKVEVSENTKDITMDNSTEITDSEKNIDSHFVEKPVSIITDNMNVVSESANVTVVSENADISTTDENVATVDDATDKKKESVVDMEDEKGRVLIYFLVIFLLPVFL